MVVDVTPTKYTEYSSKAKDFLILEYNIPVSVPGNSNSDTFALMLPPLTHLGINYIVYLNQMLVNADASNYTIMMCNEETDFQLMNYSLYVVDIDTIYHETNLNIFYGDLDTVSAPTILTRFYNASPTTMTTIHLRIAVELLPRRSQVISPVF